MDEEMVMPAFGELDPEVATAVTLAEGSAKAKVVGKGIYFELSKSDSNKTTIQMIIIPRGKTQAGEDVGMAIISRQLNTWSPRAQWRFNFVGGRHSHTIPADKSPLDVMATSVENTLNVIKRQMYYSDNTLEIQGKPIAFEITDADYTNVLAWKTPDALVRRIQKARVACGLPEKLV